VVEAGLIGDLPKPQRGLWVRAAYPGRGEVTVVSWHTPNAAGDGREVKMAAYAAMSEWLRAASRPVVIGADLNTWVDPVELRVADPADPFFEEHAFVGVDPSHGLVDAYRSVLAADGELERLARERPDGPLAVSHVLGSGTQHRMDRIFASPDLIPRAGGYEHAAAVNAGSDHALHWIDFE
jgi:endonuclease/exonuclease/phosphatase family metal-dependent hydrolase